MGLRESPIALGLLEAEYGGGGGLQMGQVDLGEVVGAEWVGRGGLQMGQLAADAVACPAVLVRDRC